MLYHPWDTNRLDSNSDRPDDGDLIVDSRSTCR
jgi:hypothetical protein